MDISSFPFTDTEDPFKSSFVDFTSSSGYDYDPISITATGTSTTNSLINLSKRRKRIDHDAIAIQEAFDSIFQLDSLQGPEFNLGHFPFPPEMDQNKNPMKEAEVKAQVKRPRRESVENTGGTSQRRLWVKNRSKAWWDLCNSPDFPEEEFKKSFRMSKSTFNMICEELESVLTKKDTPLRQAIPVRQRVAVCLSRLATGDPLREVSKRFGLGISTCHKLVLEVCYAIRHVLMPKFLQWPDEEEMGEIKREYEMVSGIPDVGGSMYTTHISIVAPKVNVATYLNKKHTERNHKTCYSVTVQGVVDHKGAFTDINVGFPGSMSDEKVLEHSTLYQRGTRGMLKDVVIVGNSGYPLMDWVLVPYDSKSKKGLTWTQNNLNKKFVDVENVSKEAFMRLKGRWKCLQKRTEVKVEDLHVFLGACCVLHNICEKRNEDMMPELRFELFDDECVAENPVRSVAALHKRDQAALQILHENRKRDQTTLHILHQNHEWDQIAFQILHQNHAGTTFI